MHLVQLRHVARRAVAVVEGSTLHLLGSHSSVYELALGAIRQQSTLSGLVKQIPSVETLNYDTVYKGESDWKLLPPFDHPDDPARIIISGTGLTHKASAENRAAMHQQANAIVTDSMRMYQIGKNGGRPAEGEIGAQPEWFYKGNGSLLKAHGEDLVVPPYGEDGGEEPEIAGAYLIGDDGHPYHLGFMVGNEFSDHRMEKQNYLYLAPSKLRNCSVGPELVLASRESFTNLTGTVSIERCGAMVWQASIYSGEENMCHSLANLEHHHFKYDMHRRPGDAHIHFFGADAFSFGDGFSLEEGDTMEVSFPALGRPLRNPLCIARKEKVRVQVRAIG